MHFSACRCLSAIGTASGSATATATPSAAAIASASAAPSASATAIATASCYCQCLCYSECHSHLPAPSSTQLRFSLFLGTRLEAAARSVSRGTTPPAPSAQAQAAMTPSLPPPAVRMQVVCFADEEAGRFLSEFRHAFAKWMRSEHKSVLMAPALRL